ncbi:TetR/AcrR family transcriptional regulator [Amycolatopsis suaedae]|uniref:TetR/AcrR family transcriptional regulator n=1 Tax=Amycolatopsis suaedae TaxID=2510978 RepID=A0A4Q7J6T8_9PSEU|nr:TetR/AcrR family transcriptional regulator [Amycolatopsis suaedae]RZQ61724.1 TetR/AcrR family transcriptional regulator [Amycolatopsis suaedae]
MTCVECGAPLTVAGRGRRPRYCSRACQAKAYRARVAAGAVGSAVERRPADPESALAEDGIVATAVTVADAEGLAAASMRRVAAELGVGTMSLYRHVSGKDELVVRMVDAVLAEKPRPDPGLVGWRARAEAAARRDWGIYRAHPWVVKVFTSTRLSMTEQEMTDIEWILAAFGEEGLDIGTTYQLALLVSSYVNGVGMLLAGDVEAERESGESMAQWREARVPLVIERAASGAYPWFAQFIEHEVELPPFDDIFEFGLQRVLDGITPMVEAGRRD